MELVAQLKQQHIEILHFFEAARAELAKGVPQDNFLVEELENLKEFLVSHLTLEDKMLYPALEKSKFKEAKEGGKKFSAEMVKISKSVLAFFDKYIVMDIQILLKNAKFKKDVGLIIAGVKKRIGVEERVLYPLYEKYCKN